MKQSENKENTFFGNQNVIVKETDKRGKIDGIIGNYEQYRVRFPDGSTKLFNPDELKAKPYNPLDDFLERADNYGFEYEILEQKIVECRDGVERLIVQFQTETNKEGYCLIGLATHFKSKNYKGESRCRTFNYMMIEPRNLSLYFDIDKDGNPINTKHETDET